MNTVYQWIFAARCYA